MSQIPDIIPRVLGERLRTLSSQFPSITVTGPRQSGKTTLCRQLFGDRPYQNLELPDVRRFAEEDPRGFLHSMPDGGILDEVQRTPSLFSYLQADIDENRDHRGRWILSGSHNFLLLESITQSLAGRTAITHLLPLEIGEWRRGARLAESWPEQILRGGFPALADASIARDEWLRSYLITYVERDVRLISGVEDLTRFRTFLELCASRSGQEWNASAIARDAGIGRVTVERWLSILEASFVVFRVRPLQRTLRKRLVKRSRIHFVDTGLLCHLLGIHSADHLLRHPLRGAIFESWVVSELHRAETHRGHDGSLSFYRDQQGLEVDAILQREDTLHLVEAKSASTFHPEMAAASRRVAQTLDLPDEPEPTVVYGGQPTPARSFATVLAWNELDHARWWTD